MPCLKEQREGGCKKAGLDPGRHCGGWDMAGQKAGTPGQTPVEGEREPGRTTSIGRWSSEPDLTIPSNSRHSRAEPNHLYGQCCFLCPRASQWGKPAAKALFPICWGPPGGDSAGSAGTGQWTHRPDSGIGVLEPPPNPPCCVTLGKSYSLWASSYPSVKRGYEKPQKEGAKGFLE